MSIEKKLKELGIVLPLPNPPGAIYQPGVLAGNFIFTAGQTPKVDGKLVYKGKVGQEVSVEDGKKAARLCCLNCLAIIKEVAGSLDRVERIVKMTGFVNANADFYQQSKVIDGASSLLYDIFGEVGGHARSAVGCSALPNNASCEVELVVKLQDK